MKAKTWLLLITATIVLQLVTSQLVNGIDWSTCPYSSRPTPLATTASIAIPPAFVSQIRNIFPEGKTPNPLLVNPDNDAFIIIESASNVTFTFILEGADYRNQFGYYIFDPSTRTVNPNPGYVPIFPDVSASPRMGANGCLFSGVTVTVGPFPATTIIGFWVRADGYSNPSNADTWSSYTTDVLTNVDGCRHIAWTKINGQVAIGFEDLRGLGDTDYNDVMFYFTTDGNFTASPGLVEVVNGTLQGCVRSDLRISTAYQCTQFSVLDATSSLACQGFIKVPDAWIPAPNDATTRSAVLANPSLFTNPDGSSICMVLADGTSVNNQWSPCAVNTAPQVFSKDGTCYYVGCERKLLIKGMTSTSSCTGQRDLLCNPTVAASVISSFPDTYTSGMAIFPQTWTVYLSDLLVGSASVNFSVSTLPQAAQQFDVMVLLDSNNMLANDFDTAKNQIPNLYTLINNKFARPPNVGFAIHTQLSATAYRLDILSRLTNDVGQLTNAIRNVPPLSVTTRLGNSQLVQSVQALASDNTIGWRGGNVFGTIIVVTVSGQQRNSTLTSSLKNALYGTGITPLYIVPSGTGFNPYPDYNTFTNTTLSMGWSYQSATYLWSNTAMLGLDTYSNSIRFYPGPGASNPFWSNIPAPATGEACVNSLCFFSGFTLTYPGNRPAGSFLFPLVASIRIPGVGVAMVNILSDEAPVVVDPFFVLNEDTTRQFSLKDFASDKDGNSLRVTFLELPQGQIIAQDAYATLVNSYDISTPFSYKPPQNFFGQVTALFRVTDGCKNSTIGTITFAVNPLNDPPTAQSASFTIDQDSSVDVDLSTLIDDVEDLKSSLVVFVKALPKNSTLFQLVSNQRVAITQTDLAISTSVRLTPQSGWFGNTSFTYYVRDTAGQVSTLGTINLQVNPTTPIVPVNNPPLCFDVVLTGEENFPLTLDTIGGLDLEGSPISITLQNITTVGGDLMMGDQFVALPTTITSGSLVTFYPIADVNGMVATIDFVVSDGTFSSDPCTASIFLVAANTSLSVTAVNSGEFTLDEGSEVAVDIDQHIFSDGPTIAVITSLPTSGQLLIDGRLAAVGTSFMSNKTFTYVPKQYYYGNDTFNWYALDTTNARADATFDFVVTSVNTPPLSSNIVISTFRASPAQITSFFVEDPDSKLADMSLILLGGSGFGTLSDKSKSAVSFPQTYKYGDWSFLWTSPDDLPYYTVTTTVATYSFQLNDGIDNSPVYTITVNLLYSNYPPTGADSVTMTPEDTPVQIILQARDYESAPENLRVVIVSASGNGNFYLDNSFTNLVVTGSQLPGKQMSFVPSPGIYSTDSPAATFSYFIVDEGSQISPVYNGLIYVNQSANLPRYGGALSFDVFEDSVLTMKFNDYIAYANGTQVETTMTISDGVYKGQLYECAEDSDPCQKIILTAGSVVLNADKQLLFAPNVNENGIAYAAFSFTLTNEDGVTRPYIVVINVIPVNDPPTLKVDYPTMPDRVIFDEDTEYIFSWTASDIDSPIANVSTKITSLLPDNAQIFVCTSYTDGKCVKGDELMPPTYVPYMTEGVWAVAYVPNPNAFDAHNFGWFNLVAEDDTGLRSPPARSLIQVLPINDPPTIFAQYIIRTASLDESGIPTVGLYDVVVNDIDVGRNNMMINITSSAGSNITFTYESAFEDKTVNGRVIPAPCSRITDEDGLDGVSCLDTKDHINEVLLKATRIQLDGSSQSYQIYITVNDLGSTDKEDRPLETSLNLVATLESSLILTSTNNTTDQTLTVTLSVSGGVSVVVLILGVVLFSCKGNGEKIDTYFEGLAHGKPEGTKPEAEPSFEPAVDGAGHGNRALFPVFGVLLAAAAKKEKILYVPAVPADTTKPDYLATIDVDPDSPSYCKVIHRLRAPTAGDELRRINWNVNTMKNRKYLIAPGMKSGNIHVIDTANPRAPKMHKTILGKDITESTGLTWPHATRCLPSGEILVSHMADKQGNAFGGYVTLTPEFEVEGHWGKNSTQLGYAFAYQASTNTMVSTGWGEPNAPKQSEGNAAPDRYGNSVWLWDIEKKEVLKAVDLGDDGMMPLEVRFMHHPDSAHGFVCAALNGCVWHVYLDDKKQWQFERVIKIDSIAVEDWILPIMPALTTDLVISPDDKFLYISNWLHGDIRQYDISDPSDPQLVSQLYLGGSLRQDGGVKMTSGAEGIEVPQVKGRKLQGAPQSLQLSLDGTRLYVTNSFVSSWDQQFYPELEGKGTQVLQIDVDVKEGGLALNKEFLVDLAEEPDGPAVAREMRLYEGDCTMDVCK